MPRIDLKDRPIVITGASSGIGRACAIACADAGMPVLVAARREDRLRALVEEIRSRGGRATLRVCDVTRFEDCAHAVEQCAAEFGSVYAVFANAGYGLERCVADSTEAEWRDIFETNFFGTLHAVRAALPRLRAQRSGHILITSSCLAKMPLPCYTAYCATKAAQHHLGRGLGVELRREGVHVSTVYPVGTRTDFFDESDKRSKGELGSTLASRTPRFTSQPPERVARAVVRALQRPRPEVWTHQRARLAFHLAAMLPRVTDRALLALLQRAERRVEKP